MANRLQVELHGGPLHGLVHEVNTSLFDGLPAQFGLCDPDYDGTHPDGPPAHHWYATDEQNAESSQPTATFVRTEKHR